MNANPTTVRAIEPLDINELVAFFAYNNVPSVTRQFHPFTLSPESAYMIALTPHQDRYYAAFMEEKIVGLVMLRGWDEGYAIPSLGILVDREHQGVGIGNLLMRHAIREARINSVCTIRLSVYGSNHLARKMYENCGFREVSRESLTVSDTPDVKQIMILDLSPSQTLLRHILPPPILSQ